MDLAAAPSLDLQRVCSAPQSQELYKSIPAVVVVLYRVHECSTSILTIQHTTVLSLNGKRNV